MTEVEKAWLAGFFEGDGSYREMQIGVQIVISQKDLKMLHYIRDLLGFGRIRELNNQYGTHYGRLEFEGRNSIKFYDLIRPYMHGYKAIELDRFIAPIAL